MSCCLQVYTYAGKVEKQACKGYTPISLKWLNLERGIRLGRKRKL